ncbi:MAG: VWA domain-containing protein [Deltaproteobacteria bacterium]|nr:VWA domain-containing protein [Deltaproteobacteria bacterium]
MRRLALLAALAISSTACGGGLQLALIRGAHQRPSNVAVFFSVDDGEGNPVPGLQAQDFRIYEDGELVSVHESRQTIVAQEVAAEHLTLLLVDMSASVTESDQAALVDSAVSQFTTSLGAQQRIGIYAFDGAAELHPVSPFARPGQQPRGAGRLTGFRSRDPSTNLHGAIVLALEELRAAMDASRAQLRFGSLVVFTDGTDRAARVSWGDMISAVDGSEVDVFAIGLGSEMDESMLEDIGRSGYVRATDAAALAQAFQSIGERITGYMQRYYLLSYCSPARAGTHEVTIEAIRGEENGFLSYTFEADGFGPTCDPNRPPPFDTSRVPVDQEGGGEVEAGASAAAPARPRRPRPRRVGVSVQAGAQVGGGGGDPELGDQ